jgi:hypothetical protein
MQKDSLRKLYIDELRDLYNAEKQMVKALPKMAKSASNHQLSDAFEEHLRLESPPKLHGTPRSGLSLRFLFSTAANSL